MQGQAAVFCLFVFGEKTKQKCCNTAFVCVCVGAKTSYCFFLFFFFLAFAFIRVPWLVLFILQTAPVVASKDDVLSRLHLVFTGSSFFPHPLFAFYTFLNFIALFSRLHVLVVSSGLLSAAQPRLAYPVYDYCRQG